MGQSSERYQCLIFVNLVNWVKCKGVLRARVEKILKSMIQYKCPRMSVISTCIQQSWNFILDFVPLTQKVKIAALMDPTWSSYDFKSVSDIHASKNQIDAYIPNVYILFSIFRKLYTVRCTRILVEMG